MVEKTVQDAKQYLREINQNSIQPATEDLIKKKQQIEDQLNDLEEK